MSCLTFDRGERKQPARHGSRLKLGNPPRCPLALIEQNVTALRRQSFEERKRKKMRFQLRSPLSLTAAAATAASLPSRMRGGEGRGGTPPGRKYLASVAEYWADHVNRLVYL